MLPKQFKLVLRNEPNYFQTAQKFFTPLFLVYYKKSLLESHFLVIIPKKTISKAAKRNALKRQIYAVLENKLTVLPKFQLVLILRKNNSKFDLKKEIEQIFIKLVKSA